MADRKTAEVKAPSQDPKKKKKKDKPELSTEDKELMDNIELLVGRALDPDMGIKKLALETLAHEIKTSTSTMTSVPKPLKFLRPHYEKMKAHVLGMEDCEAKEVFADIVSVAAQAWGKRGARDCLHFKRLGEKGTVDKWGIEYVRTLAGEIGAEYNAQMERSDEKAQAGGDSVEPEPMADEGEGEKEKKEKEKSPSRDESMLEFLYSLAEVIVPYHIEHNADAEACDLVMELSRLDILEKHVQERQFERICNYLIACAAYLPEPEDSETLMVVVRLYQKFKRPAEALRLAFKLKKWDLMDELYKGASDRSVKRQLAFMMAAHGVVPQKSLEDEDEDAAMEEEEDDRLEDILGNLLMSEHFQLLGKELEITEAKTPEDVYKSHLTASGRGTTAAQTDSARQNLASTIVNAFVNAGFGTDKLMTTEDSNWLFMNKDHGMMSAAASVGMITLWDVDAGLAMIDKYLYSKEDYARAGALLGVGLVSAGVRHPQDPALALLQEHLEPSSPQSMRIGAIMGLAIAYAGTGRPELLDLLMPLFVDTETPIEIAAHAALAAGVVFVSTGHADLTEAIAQALFDRTLVEGGMKSPVSFFLILGLSLLYLGLQEESDVAMGALSALEGDIQKYAIVVLQSCAYAGTGSVLVIQKLLRICNESIEEEEKRRAEAEMEKEEQGEKGAGAGAGAGADKDKDKDKEVPLYPALAVLGVALVALGEDIGEQMLLRMSDHFIQFGSVAIRRGVPLALALLNLSNPQLPVLDKLSKLSHDSNEQVAQCAVFGIGLTGAGTNNWRAATLLRNLADYHSRDPANLFMVRLAQGLLHLGKGTIAINPKHSDQLLMRPTALAGLLVVLHSMTDVSHTILSTHHYLLYYLATAMRPRMLVTVGEDLEPLPVSVRVGQAVDTTGQPGRGRNITSFQTQTTPALMGHGERAELATDDCALCVGDGNAKDEPLTSVLEGFVVLRKKAKPEAEGEGEASMVKVNGGK